MRKLTCALTLLGVTFLGVRYAYANPPANSLLRPEYRLRENIHKSPLGNSYSTDPNSRRYENSPEAYRAFRSTKSICKGGNCTPEDPMEKALSNMQPDNKHHAMNPMPPMAGFVDTLNSQLHTNQLGIILSSPVVLYNTTMMLTEPAVAAAVQNSAMYGLNSVQSRYMAENAFMQSLEGQPDTKEMVLRAYTECVAEFIRKRDRGEVDPNTGQAAFPGVDEDERSWIAAQSECMADRIKSVDQIFPGSRNFNDFEYTSADDGTGIGFDFLFDPSHPAWFTGGTPSGGSQDFISLTEYLFNESNWKAQNLSYVDVLALKNDFRTLLGDYLFWFDANQGSGSSTGPQQRRSASRELKYKKVPPQKSFDDFYGEIYIETFRSIMFMVKNQCEAVGVSTGGTPFDPSHIACRKGGGVATEAEFIQVSTNGYQMDCSMVAMLLNRFRADYPRVKQGFCDQLDPNGPSDPGTLFDNQADVKSGHRAVSFLSTRIALGQIYTSLGQIDQILNSVTSTGGFETFAKRYADQLIYSAVGSQNYMNDYVNIVDSINQEFRPEIQALTAKEVGKASGKFSDGIGANKGTEKVNPNQ